jgi:RNA polymerase sigma factor (sigma-70 family)
VHSAAATKDICEDRAWLDAFRAGEKAALERVFCTYAPPLAGYLRRRGIVNMQDQDDILQEVFAQVLSPHMRQRYDGVRPYAAFLRGVTAHVCVDHVRARGVVANRSVAFEDDHHDALDAWSPRQPMPDEVVETTQEHGLVDAFVATLDPEEKKVVNARFVESLSQRDAATHTGLSRQQLRTLEARLLQKLKNFLPSTKG